MSQQEPHPDTYWTVEVKDQQVGPNESSFYVAERMAEQLAKSGKYTVVKKHTPNGRVRTIARWSEGRRISTRGR